MTEKAKELISEFTKEILKIGWNDAIENATTELVKSYPEEEEMKAAGLSLNAELNPKSVGITDFDRARVGYHRMSVFEKEVWNKAIEAAACQVDGGLNAEAIRRLKK